MKLADYSSANLKIAEILSFQFHLFRTFFNETITALRNLSRYNVTKYINTGNISFYLCHQHHEVYITTLKFTCIIIMNSILIVRKVGITVTQVGGGLMGDLFNLIIRWSWQFIEYDEKWGSWSWHWLVMKWMMMVKISVWHQISYFNLELSKVWKTLLNFYIFPPFSNIRNPGFNTPSRITKGVKRYDAASPDILVI